MSDQHRPAELHDLDRGTCLDLLASQKVGRLVLTGSQTTVAPVNFVVAGGAIVIRADARSHGSPAAGTAAAFEIDAFDVAEESGWSVVVRGRLEDITDTAMDDVDLQERLRPWAPGPKDRWLRVTIDDVSGRWLAVPTASRPSTGAATSDERGAGAPGRRPDAGVHRHNPTVLRPDTWSMEIATARSWSSTDQLGSDIATARSTLVGSSTWLARPTRLTLHSARPHGSTPSVANATTTPAVFSSSVDPAATRSTI